MQDFTKGFTNDSKTIESICKYKMIMFMLMLNSFQNSCKKKTTKMSLNNRKIKPLQNNKNEIKNQKNENNNNNAKTFFFLLCFQSQRSSTTCITQWTNSGTNNVID